MRYLCLASVVIAMSGSAAIGADLSTPTPSPGSTYNWTGIYAGIQAGWLGPQTTGTVTNTPIPPTQFIPVSVKPSSGLLGGFIGYNYQFANSNIVVGAEADLNAVLGSKAKQTVTSTGIVTTYDIRAWQSTTGDIRARLGYAFNNILPYVDVGLAFGDTKSNYSLAPAATPFYTFNGHSVGVTLGGGLEYAFTKNLIGRVEYRYTNLGSSSFRSAAVNGAGKITFQSNAVLVGLSYKFD